METTPNTLPTVNFGELAAQTPPTLSPDAAALVLGVVKELTAGWEEDPDNKKLHAVTVGYQGEPN